MRRSDDFARTVRRGQRAGRGTLVAHYLTPPVADAELPPLVGFVVGRAVGGSVRRHRVARQLRHLVRDRLPLLPPGSLLVIRALPASAGKESAVLGTDLDSALGRLLGATPTGVRP